MKQIEDIKKSHFEDIKARDVILIVRGDYGWEVRHWLPDGVTPSSDYDTAYEAASRVCQLLKLTNAVVPQRWPEIAQIGGPQSPPPMHRVPAEGGK